MLVTQKIAPSKINEQVSRILKTPEFRRSRVLSDFLKYVVKETLKGNEQTLKEYVIATEVLKKSADFNPQLDAVVRINARRLRQFLENYYLDKGADDPITISIPKGRYIPLFEKNTSKGSTVTTEPGSLEAQMKSMPTIVVVPFKNMDSNERVHVICSVLCEDLSVELSRAKELKVLSYDSGEVTAHSEADYVIGGSCFLEDKHLKINIKLRQASENQLLWAETLRIENFEENHLSGYREIIKKVVAMTCGYFGIIYRKTINEHVPQDYDILFSIYWHNKFHRNFSVDGFNETLKALEKALLINPDNGLLIALKAELILNLCAMDAEQDEDCYTKGSNLVKKAVSVDPTNQHAWQVYTWAKLLEKDKSESMRAAERCLSVNPSNAMYMGAVGFGYVCAGEYEKGLELMLESIELNPHYPWVTNLGLSFYYFHKNNFKEALYWAELINRPGLLWDPLIRASAYGFLNKAEEASQAVKDLFILSPGFQERAVYIVDRFIFDKELQHTILEGLTLAGIDISHTS